jgi:hypothetical protein
MPARKNEVAPSGLFTGDRRRLTAMADTRPDVRTRARRSLDGPPELSAIAISTMLFLLDGEG